MTAARRQQLFEKELPRLLLEHPGKFALVCKGQVWIYSTESEAMAAGFEKCGRPNDFLVARIEVLRNQLSGPP